MNDIEVVILLLLLLVFDCGKTKLDNLPIVGAFFLDCLFEIVERTFFDSCLGLGLCLGCFYRICELLDCSCELSEIIQSLLI